MSRVFVLLLAVAVAVCVAELPSGVHISLTETPGQVRAMWALPSTSASPTLNGTCAYGRTPTSLPFLAPASLSYTYAAGGFKGALFNVVMSNLTFDAVYYYKCGSDGLGYSNVFSFHMPPSAPSTPVKIVVWGDMGVDNAVSTPKYTRAAVAQDILQENYTLIINVGDTSYADDYQPPDTNSRIGDEYWASIEPAAANAPLMLCPGNHEDQFNFAAHLNRTHMPVVGTGPLRRFYYSFDYGPIHFVTISTEHPYANGTEQWLFVQDDLKRADTRRDTIPWVVVWTHHPFYCSSLKSESTRCGTEMDSYLAAYESMFNDYSVDIFMAGHNHMYERTYPVRNRVPIKQYHRPGAPVYIVEGDAGNIESIDSQVFDVPWCAFHGTGRATGYGRIEANQTAFTYTHLESESRTVLDTFTLTK